MVTVITGDCGIHVSCIWPMGVDTPMLEPAEGGEGSTAQALTPCEMPATVLSPEEVADVVIERLEQERFSSCPRSM